MHVLKHWVALPRGIRWVVGGAAALIVVVAVAWALFVPVAYWLAARDVGSVTGAVRVLRLQTARDAARGRLLTLGAGVFAVGALWFTARNFTLARRQVDLARQAMEVTERGQQRALELTEQGQVTDRYTKAIEQLGSDKLDVRIGGIYALERVARDSPRDHSTVMDVLAAFVREHSHEPSPTPEPDDEGPLFRPTRPDVQAAITVIGRRNHVHDRGPISLAGAVLPRADLSGAALHMADLSGIALPQAILARADLSGANLIAANLTAADIKGADLSGAIFMRRDHTGRRTDLTGADLTGANLTSAFLLQTYVRSAALPDANLTDANLTDADFTDSFLIRANLTRAKLWRANLTRADLTRADLTDADLSHANVSYANFGRADLTGAIWAHDYPVWEGWERDPGSRRLRRASEDTGDLRTH